MARSVEVVGPITENLRQHRLEVMDSLSPLVGSLAKKQLLDPRTAWQPSRYIPEITEPGEVNEQMTLLRKEAQGLPKATALVVISGLITEEGLPMFTAKIGKSAPVKLDEAEEQLAPWEIWGRGWAAEERRHGQVLRGWMEMSGLFNRDAIERDLHKYLLSGFDPKFKGDPYFGEFYATGQERATQLVHGGTSKDSKTHGSSHLFRIGGALSGDEGRHHGFYLPVGQAIFDIDPQGATGSFHRLIVDGLDMPGSSMEGFNLVKEATTLSGIYGIDGYAKVFGEMVRDFNLEKIPLVGEADKQRHDIFRRLKIIQHQAERRESRDKTDLLKQLNLRAAQSPWFKAA